MNAYVYYIRSSRDYMYAYTQRKINKTAIGIYMVYFFVMPFGVLSNANKQWFPFNNSIARIRSFYVYIYITLIFHTHKACHLPTLPNLSYEKKKKNMYMNWMLRCQLDILNPKWKIKIMIILYWRECDWIIFHSLFLINGKFNIYSRVCTIFLFLFLGCLFVFVSLIFKLKLELM